MATCGKVSAMKNAAKVAALSLLVIATLAGCFKGKVDLTLNSDNTIDGSMVIAIQSGIGESLGMSDEDLLKELNSDGSGIEGAKESDYNEEGFVGKKYTFENEPLDSFQNSEDGSDISITREGDNFIVDGTWDTEDADTEGMDPGAMGAEFTFSVTFPGKVSDHNGELSEDGKTVTWNLLDPPATLHAEGKATEGGSPWAWLVIGLGVLIIVAVIVVVIVRSRSKKAAVPALADAPVAPAVEAGSAPAEFSPEPVAVATSEPVAETPAESVAEPAAEATAEPVAEPSADEPPANPDAR